ncbi:hypothetical protein [Streptomyces sp. NPDC101455]|uniref:hypothetical protein n=1 Tax=Streptomyces sp. NPDC101455 TaxID=3366142 RepID=UPI0038184D42
MHQRACGPGLFEPLGVLWLFWLFCWLHLYVDDMVWSGLSAEAQAEVDGPIAAGRNIQAIMVMRERSGLDHLRGRIAGLPAQR